MSSNVFPHRASRRNDFFRYIQQIILLTVYASLCSSRHRCLGTIFASQTDLPQSNGSGPSLAKGSIDHIVRVCLKQFELLAQQCLVFSQNSVVRFTIQESWETWIWGRCVAVLAALIAIASLIRPNHLAIACLGAFGSSFHSEAGDTVGWKVDGSISNRRFSSISQHGGGQGLHVCIQER